LRTIDFDFEVRLVHNQSFFCANPARLDSLASSVTFLLTTIYSVQFSEPVATRWLHDEDQKRDDTRLFVSCCIRISFWIHTYVASFLVLFQSSADRTGHGCKTLLAYLLILERTPVRGYQLYPLINRRSSDAQPLSGKRGIFASRYLRIFER
jgi:hypothetical protein